MVEQRDQNNVKIDLSQTLLVGFFLICVVLLLWFVLQSIIGPVDSEKITLKDFMDFYLKVLGVIAALIGFVFAWRRIKAAEQQAAAALSQAAVAVENNRLSERRLLSEQFQSAVRMLTSDKIDEVIGAIFVIEHIAKSATDFHVPSMEVLSSFVRRKSSWNRRIWDDIHHEVFKRPSGAVLTELNYVDVYSDSIFETEMPEAIKFALTVIGRRNIANDPIGYRPELKEVLIVNGRLDGLCFRNVQFSQCIMALAKLTNCDFTGASFIGAVMYGVDFNGSNLTDCTMSGVTMDSTSIAGANLTNARFYMCQFRYQGFSNVQGISKETFVNCVSDETNGFPPVVEYPNGWRKPEQLFDERQLAGT